MSKSMTEFNFIVWIDNGGEGWTWEGFNTIEEALNKESYGFQKIITKPVKYTIKEVSNE